MTEATCSRDLTNLGILSDARKIELSDRAHQHVEHGTPTPTHLSDDETAYFENACDAYRMFGDWVTRPRRQT